MFDPKDIYSKLDLPKITEGYPVHWELILKDWPCTDLAYIRLFTPMQAEWVLIAPGCTLDGTVQSLRTALERLTGQAAHCGGDACGI